MVSSQFSSDFAGKWHQIFKSTGLHSFLDFRIADKRVGVFLVPLTKRTPATKRKGWTVSPGSKCKDFSLWKNRIPSASQCSFLFVRKIFLSVSFLINALWTFHIVCFELESTLKGIYLPLKDLQEL